MEIDKNTETTVAGDGALSASSASGRTPAAQSVEEDSQPLEGAVVVDTTEPAPDNDTVRSFKRKVLGTVLGTLLGLVLVVTIVAFTVDARNFGFGDRWGWDQYVFRPGSATSATSAVEIPGQELFPADGDIAFTTVAVVRDPKLIDILQTRFSDGHELIEPERVDGNRSREETRQVTRFQMVRSQSDAAVVALRFLGYDPQPIARGAVVVELIPGQPAERVLALGDTIVGVDGVAVTTVEEAVAILSQTRPGDSVTFGVTRLGTDPTAEPELVAVELAPRPTPGPDDPEQTEEQRNSGFLGVLLENDPSLDMPFDITVNVGEVRGPSAGLAFSLAIVEVLTPGSLTGGLKVATTGTIGADGKVGVVGGVPQKTIAAENAGMDLFLVPPEEFDEALEYADKMEVRVVETFEQAIDVLSEYGGNGREVEGSMGGAA